MWMDFETWNVKDYRSFRRWSAGERSIGKKNLCEQWKYLMDEESTFAFYAPDSSEYVWKTTEVYRKLYMGDASHWMFWDMFNFEKLKHKKPVGCLR